MPGDGEESEVERNSEQTPVRKFTWQELSRLNKRHNAHIAYRGKVYDVSRFISRHPGGVDQIMLGAGRDITQLFESYHRLDIAKVMDKFYVGELVSNEMPVFPRPGEFYKTLKERVDQYFKENNIDPKIDYWMFFRYFMFLVSSITCLGGLMCFHSSWILGITFAFGWGLFSALVAMTCTHDASHFAITHKPWVWKMVGSVHDFYHGASMFTWTYQHVLGHHPFTNIDGADPDIVTAGRVRSTLLRLVLLVSLSLFVSLMFFFTSPYLYMDTPDIRRIKWEQTWLPRYFYQHVYVPILYCFLGMKTRLQDFLIVFTRMNSTIRVNDPSPSQWFVFLAGKVTHCIMRFYIPYQFMPLSTLLFYNLIAEVVGSYWLALIFQTSHVISEVEWPKPDENNMVDMDWAEMQVATTQDYATESWFWNMFTGALNHQTTHHLFPGVIQSHYPKITPIVRQTCEEFGIQYHYVGTTQQALGCHIRHLQKLGQVKTEEQAKKKDE